MQYFLKKQSAVCALARATKEAIVTEAEKQLPRETGGILMGHWEGSRVVVEDVSGPGPQAEHQSSGFRRDGDYCQQFLDRVVNESEGRLDYLGEWHSHPLPSGPSALDVRAMQWVSKNERYAAPRPILLLCVRSSAGDWATRVFALVRGRLIELPVVEY